MSPPQRERRPGGNRAADHQSADCASLRQIPPVGSTPALDVCLVGALLYASPSAASGVLRLVLDDDIEKPALATVLAAIRRLMAADKPAGPQLVFDELRRAGELTVAVADQLRAAVGCGAADLAAQDYGAAVVAGSLRRRMASVGHAITEAAQSAAEHDLSPMVASAAVSVSYAAHRLAELRGER